MKFRPRQILLTLLIVVIVFLGMNFSLDSFEIDGESMEPGFHNGQYILVNKLTYRLGSPHRGDVIVFHHPQAPNQLYIKRIIGLPEEEVEIIDNKIYIDSKLLEESSYIPSLTYQGSYSIVVPPDHYFVLGDNRNHSSDSRLGWTVPRDNIVGNAWISYWPVGDLGLTPGYSWALTEAP